MRFSARISAERDDSWHESGARQTLNQNGVGEREQWLALMSNRGNSTSLAVTSNVTWQTTSAGIISMSPELVRMGEDSGQTEDRQWLSESTLKVRDQNGSKLKSLSLPFKWTFKPTRKSQLEFRFFSHESRLSMDQARTDENSTAANAIRDSDTLLRGRSKKLELDYRATMAGGHAMKAGISLFRIKNRDEYYYRLNGLQDASLNALGRHRRSTSQQRRVYLQDEWRISESIASTLGVSSGEDSINVEEGGHGSGVGFRVWSPSLHMSKKIGGDDKRQVRLSVARSFKAASVEDLTKRPEINPLAPCLSTYGCPANTIDTADTAGNLLLQPERALALNIAYEIGIGDDSQISLEIFQRRIDGKQGNEILLENAPWSDVPRYVSRPTNLGDAQVTGINVGLELDLRDVSKSAPKVTLRGGLGLARSHVANLPGPDNHLNKLTPWTAKVGGSFNMKSVPLKFDLDASWSPGLWTRTSRSERVFAPRSFECDTSMIWAVNKSSSLVFSLGTRYPRTKQPITEYSANDQLIRLYTREKRSARLKLQFETKL